MYSEHAGDEFLGGRERNGYVTALRCPDIYLIISLNEVGEAPTAPGPQTLLVCNRLTVYLEVPAVLQIQEITHTARNSQGLFTHAFLNSIDNNPVGYKYNLF